MSDTGDLELDAEGDTKGSNSQAVRKNIAIKLKASPKGRGKGRRGSAKKKPVKKVVEQDDPMEPDPEEDEDIGSSAIPTTKFTISDEPVHKSKPLRWDHKVLMLGEKVVDPTMYCCERCGLPILVYGRMLPCKHVFCFDCARKNDKSCPRCSDPVQRVEQSALGTVYVCTYGASKHDPLGCRRTYLSQRDLQAHVMHRHSKHPSEGPSRPAKAQSQSQSMKPLPVVSQVSTSTTRQEPFSLGSSAVSPMSVSVTSGSNMAISGGKSLAFEKSLAFDASSIYHQRHTAPPPISSHVPPPMPVVSQPPPPLPMQNHAPMQSHPQMQGHGPLQSHPPLQSHTPILTLPPTNQPPPQLPPMNQPPPSQPLPMQSQQPPPHPAGMTGTPVRQPHPGGQGHMDTYHSMQPVVPRTNLITVPIQDEGDYRKHDQGSYAHGGLPGGNYQNQQHYPPAANHPNVSMTVPVSYSGPPPMFSMPPPHTAGPNLRSPLSQPPPRGPGGPPVSSHGGMPPQGPPRFNAPHHYEERPHTPPYNQQGGHSPRPWGAGPPRGPPRGPGPRGNYY